MRRPSPDTTTTRGSAVLEPCRPARALLVLALLAIGGRAVAQGPVTAVWKKARIDFSYQSSIAIYSCDSLGQRIASILTAVGARSDLEIKVTNCSPSIIATDTMTIGRPPQTWQPGTGTSPLPRAEWQQDSTIHVRLSIPVEITPEVEKELKADKSRRELISRVTGNPIPKFDDPVPFAAERRVVTLSHKTIGLEAAECELLDRLVTTSFEKLGLRVVSRGFACDRRRVSKIHPTVVVEALLPAIVDSRETQPAPAKRGDDTQQPGAPSPAEERPAEPAGDEPPG